MAPPIATGRRWAIHPARASACLRLGRVLVLLSISVSAGRLRAADVTINIDTAHPAALAAGFSGLNAPQLRNAAEYWDPNLLRVVTAMKPGWIRFPAGTASDAYDWTTGNLKSSWVSQFSTIPGTYSLLSNALPLTQAKGGVWLKDFVTFTKTLGAAGVICVNGFTDTADSAGGLALSAQSYGLTPSLWELTNEAFLFPPAFFADATDYANRMQPYAQNIAAVIPGAVIAVPFAGTYFGAGTRFTGWDSTLASYTPRYWNAVSVHVFPLTTTNLSTADTQAFLNGVLAHATADYIRSYFVPLIGNTPIYITELNSTGNRSLVFQTYLYNGIFLAEYIARMSAVSSVKGVGATALYMGKSYYSGLIQAFGNDYERYLATYVYPGAVDTSGWPFGLYRTAPALALQVANGAINNSTQLWPTTVSGGVTVPISGFDGQPVPAVYAQAYQGAGGKRYLLITNKSSSPQSAAVQLAGVPYTGTYTLYYVASNDPSASNNASNPTAVQITASGSGSAISIPSYCVMRAEF